MHSAVGGQLNFVTSRSRPSSFKLGFVYFFIHLSSQFDFCGSMAPRHTAGPTFSGGRRFRCTTTTILCY
jgi:hypothetical protein